MPEILFLGLDVGSTTVKQVFINKQGATVLSCYRRHFSDVRQTLGTMLKEAYEQLGDISVYPAITGSAGMALSESLKLPFIQEVIASTICIRRFIPQTNVAIELGGEDAKITFFDGSIDQRMNETCAGGTGAFIDQMASFLKTDAAGLNDLAQKHTTIYPIASRCGVFAKTDIMPLLNEGAAREDIAASIFQAVVDQTVGGLACGRAIKRNIAFLGGPLYFLSGLRERFIKSLALTDEEVIFPDNAHFFVALGAALEMLNPSTGRQYSSVRLADLAQSAASSAERMQAETEALPPLFESPGDLEDFYARHASHTTPRGELALHKGKVFLGFDIGSTTIKAALIDENGTLLFSHYEHSKGEPLAAAVKILAEIYQKLPEGVTIARAGATGYGGGLIKTAIGVDLDEVETVAHFKAARTLHPGVSFILDIGGQDMKCLHIADGVIDRIMLNEACSAGCGVFIETFAKSLGMNNDAFTQEALQSRRPVDLGSRCTVFMNSKVKQAQKEGASVGDIAAGLAYSVIRNALYKVIKTPSTNMLGTHVVAQGGAFLNNSLLRAFELLLGREIYRPDISGLMGAYGVALLARDEYIHLLCNDSVAKPRSLPQIPVSGLISKERLAEFSWTTTTRRCLACGNRCLLTLSTFNDGRKHISGNRCEKGAAQALKRNEKKQSPNLFRYKYRRLFDYYKPLKIEDAPRGVIGIPRVLNMFENYPFWFTFFTNLGYRVELSAHSGKKIYDMGISTIPSQTACYPAKLAHGHVIDLANKGIKHIFYPCVPNELKEYPEATGTFNCPVVTGYPELLRLNLDILQEKNITLHIPFLPIDHPKRLRERLAKELPALPNGSTISRKELTAALQAAEKEQQHFKAHIRRVGERIVRQVLQSNGTESALILAGHPYHIDPGINHGIADLVADMGVAVLTEDSVAHLGSPPPLRVVNQWTYHARLYRAAALAAEHRNLGLVQFTSFGCGLDAVTSDQVQEILEASGRVYTLIKIDEGANLGAARIRVRSLLAAERAKALSAAQGRQAAKSGSSFPHAGGGTGKKSTGSQRTPQEASPKSGYIGPIPTHVPVPPVPSLHNISQAVARVLPNLPALPEIAKLPPEVRPHEPAYSDAYALRNMADSTPEHGLASSITDRVKSGLTSLKTAPPQLEAKPRPSERNAGGCAGGCGSGCKTGHRKMTPPRVAFSDEMRKTHTILVPQLSPIHFGFIEKAIGHDGYNIELLPHVDRGAIEAGLKYINNDVCYPALMAVGQLIQAVHSGKYDTDKIALLISQTGGGCRATNYIAFLRKALADSGFSHIPVISFNLAGMEENPGFSISTPLLKRIIRGAVLADVLSRLYYRTRPYEKNKGEATAVLQQQIALCSEAFLIDDKKTLSSTLEQAVAAFAAIDVHEEEKPRVGVVGEIYLKFNPDANNDVMDIIESEGGEAVPGDIVNFLLYCLYDDVFRATHLSGSKLKALKSKFFIWWVESLRNLARKALARHPRFGQIHPLSSLVDRASPIITPGHQTGEGWLLTAEMVELIETGTPNIVCLQPFACLPNHITGKGVIKELKRRYPKANIAAIDYDSGASEVNQLNRIKLMMAVAHQNLKEK